MLEINFSHTIYMIQKRSTSSRLRPFANEAISLDLLGWNICVSHIYRETITCVDPFLLLEVILFGKFFIYPLLVLVF